MLTSSAASTGSASATPIAATASQRKRTTRARSSEDVAHDDGLIAPWAYRHDVGVDPRSRFDDANELGGGAREIGECARLFDRLRPALEGFEYRRGATERAERQIVGATARCLVGDAH